MRHASTGVTRRLFSIMFVAAALTLGTLCNAAAAADDADVTFGVPPWPGEYVKAAAAREILDTLGYTTKQFEGGGPFLMNSVGQGDLDVYMAVWRPVNNGVIEPLLDSGDVVLLTTNIKDAKYNIVVPQYVWDAGVHSIADLHKHADKFGHKIYGIEVGNVGNRLMKDAIEDNTYDLQGWTLVASSTAGMLAQADRATRHHDWIAFLGWKPHSMNIRFDLKYLEDPLNIWGPEGGKNAVQTVGYKGFIDTNPNVTRFLKQMNVGAKTQSGWIYQYAYKDQPADKVAHEWIQSHEDRVAQWLDGVTTADGNTGAFDVVKKEIGFKANDD